MKEVLEVIVKSLVKNPDEVEIEEVIADDEKNVTLKIKVADDDMGRVIGKDGRIVKAVRTVMKAVATKEKKWVTVEFVND